MNPPLASCLSIAVARPKHAAFAVFTGARGKTTPVLVSCLALALASGCSTATTAGCLSGVAVGGGLAGLSAATAPNNNYDTGLIVLGGALFGVAAGCTAAGVTAAIARNEKQKPRSVEETEPSDKPVVSAPAAPRQLMAQSNLAGVAFAAIAQPTSGSRAATLRFKRFGPTSMFASCAQLELGIDGQQLSYPLVKMSNPQPTAVAEIAQATVDMSVVRAMSEAKTVEFKLCELTRHLDLASTQRLATFVADFLVHAPAGTMLDQLPIEAVKPQPQPEVQSTPASSHSESQVDGT